MRPGATLSKRDMMLAQKALESRKIRMQSEEIKRKKRERKPVRKHSQPKSLASINSSALQRANGKATVNRNTFTKASFISHPRSDLPSSTLQQDSDSTDENVDKQLAEEMQFGSRKTIVLPNGATLREVYARKHGDVWGSIARLQSVEAQEEHEHRVKKKKDAFVSYLDSLQSQIEHDHQKKRDEKERDHREHLKTTEEGFFKFWDDRQKFLRQKAIDEDVRFRQLAEEDIGLVEARKRREREVDERIDHNLMLKARRDQEEDRLKQRRRREALKTQLEETKRENDALIACRKQRQREEWEEEVKLNEQYDQMMQEMEDKRVAVIKEREERQDQALKRIQEIEKLMSSYFTSEETKLSEEIKAIQEKEDQKQREKDRKRREAMLLQERTIAEQLREKQRRKEEEERENMAIAKYLRDKDEELERREREKQRKKRLAEEEYLRDIEGQIHRARQRKFRELVGEMTPREQSWQASTLQRAQQKLMEKTHS